MSHTLQRPTVHGVARGSERGQALILFVAVFSILLAMAAFSIDQGLWLNHRRIAQKDADAAARAGAAQYLTDVMNPDFSAASDSALAMAAANGAPGLPAAAPTPAWSPNNCDGSTETTCARTSCPLADGTVIDNAPSIEIAVPRPAPGLFLRIFGIDKEDSIGAKSTACVGSVRTVGPGSMNTVPIELISSDQEPDSCFANGVPRLGMQCVIVGAAQGNHPRGAFFVPEAGSCWGNGNGGGQDEVRIGEGITYGIDGACSVNAGAGCTDTTCVNDFNGNMQGQDISAFHDRLARTDAPGGRTLCADPADGPTAFRAAFTYADGTPMNGNQRPPGLNDPVNSTGGNADPAGTAYMEQACWSPRVIIVIVSDDGTNVTGFAAVFVTGCFEEVAGQPGNALANQLNDCGAADQYGGHTEVRGVLVRVVMSGTIGGIGPIDETSPLAIETTR